MHISTLIIRNMLTWMLSTKKKYSLIKKIHPYVFTFRWSHFTHTRILHMLPSLQHETWYTFTDSQESANNIHTHGFKFRYTLGHTQTCISTLKHYFNLLWHVQVHSSLSWIVLLTRADTDTFTHINILRSHSHENYHTFTHCIHDQKFTHTHEVSVPTMTHSFTHAGQHWHKEEHAQVFICTQTVKLTRKLTNSVT